MSLIKYDSVSREFPELSEEDILDILKNHYRQGKISNVRLSILISDDAKRNFTNRPETISRILRKHLGIPEKSRVNYPVDQIDNEITQRIRDMAFKRNRSEMFFRTEFLRIALSFSKKVRTKKEVETEIEARSKLTGLSKVEIERRLYCAYFQIGIKIPEEAIEA
jgi:hypothetical protein